MRVRLRRVYGMSATARTSTAKPSSRGRQTSGKVNLPRKIACISKAL
ncbi:hypothetical protein [Desulfovibrio sp. MES5]|nr:hypothetical protein [Desulfovibrio sp. MES5]